MPADMYGLRLSTTTEAAAAYNAGLRKILLVRSGAEEDLRASVRADPGFALAHAARALLGHEYGARVDVARELTAATACATRAGTDRERGHVATVAAYLRGRPGAVPGYLRAFPRDALLLSVAVPTIAFAGATSAPPEAWALVESLAPAYGADWWYAGMLAFVRQEQERWDEAMALCERALAVEPASGHAVHARAHVHYETGDHGAGLSWLDAWLDRLGPRAHHGAHFSWHAALHELALQDAAAVRRRYHRQLAPPRVTGMRTLVDSASLLWRCELAGTWDGPIPIGAVLDAADPRTLVRPGTPFAAWHAAVALAAAGDTAGLARLARYAADGPTEVFTTVVTPLVDGLRAYVEGRHDDAATALLSIRSRLTALGGSRAQREVIEQTLLHALLGAGRLDEARTLLTGLLDRRPLTV